MDGIKEGREMDGKASVAFSSINVFTFINNVRLLYLYCVFFQLAVHLSCSEGALCVNQSQLSSKLADHVHAQHIIIPIPITITIFIISSITNTINNVNFITATSKRDKEGVC